MIQDLLTTNSLILGFLIALVSCWVLLPFLIKLSPKIGLVDKPNFRKVHQKLIPAIGGLTIALAVTFTALVYAPLRHLLTANLPLTIALATLTITGVLDDRLNLPAILRLGIQLGCAYLIAKYGIRLTSLHGVFGITELSVFFQYAITMFVLTVMANAFNLIDGVDGLAGSLAFGNSVVFSVLAIVVGQQEWLALLLPVAGALLAFLRYNWRPAKLFMGDGGSVVLGFLTAALGIIFIEGSYKQTADYGSYAIILTTASCMIPLIDALRVAINRMRKGKSPFAADKNHMHHWFLKHRFVHSEITLRIVKMHAGLTAMSILASFIFSVTTIIFLQIFAVIIYTWLIQFSHAFLKNVRLVKALETKFVP
ncbi:glycosyltransferase family 4 protein [Spirosoma linguale]|uniref:Glycosyl transferase, family 4, conserved region n=1 Tax=Spirosoma linguale (strain ATCC 33905 / DSM 74 / LMG 10896 / Claus 1) TaxID=504472 RepID=D2QM92_SPILD|nr:Glycosyl transferase, family 4, conserved region [Spirosoma linguale DSM 74]